jgi:hypothetical protein
MTSGGFGKWFQEQQNLADLESGGIEAEASSWGKIWNTLGGEKKAEAEDIENDSERSSFLGALSSWADGVKASTAEATGTTQESSLFGLSYQTRFKGFVATIIASGFFIFMAFAVGMPVVVIRPSKFALCFTVGSLLFMSSFALLRGPSAHLMSMMTADRLPFSISYVGSMFLTLYAALVVRSYLFVVLASTLQIATLAYYFLSFIPGGTTGAKVFLFAFLKTAKMTLSASFVIFKGCVKMVMS